MATRNIVGTIQVRQDTSANWTNKNPVLKNGEFGYDTTNQKVKVGNGSTAFNSLPFLASETVVDTKVSAGQSAAQSAAKTYTDGQISALRTELQTYTNSQITAAINDSWSKSY